MKISSSVVVALFVVLGDVSRAYTPSSSCSSFCGRACTTRPISEEKRRGRGGWMEMKKGKPNIPPQMRSNYRRQQDMEEMRQEMAQSTKPSSDGMPSFNLFVRTKMQNMWYPCGTFRGDEKAKTLAESYRDGGLLAGTSKSQLDRGISGSLFQQVDSLTVSIVRSYPFLKKRVSEFEYGYQLVLEGLSDEQSEITPVEVKEQKGFLDNVKGMFGQ